MKIAVVGSRSFPDKKFVIQEVKKAFKDHAYLLDLTLVSGGARGPDAWSEQAIQEAQEDFPGLMGINIKKEIFKPDWDGLGKCAGFMRNEKIINEADLVLAFWDGSSNGTKHSIDLARKNKKPINIYVRVV